MRQFWLIWAENGGPPTVPHYSEETARLEAERLARNSPNTNFCVMELVGSCKKSDVQWDQPELADEMPF